MTMRRTYIAGMMLKAYRQVCKISTEEFAKKAHMSKSTITKLEAIGGNSITELEQFSYCVISFGICERIADGMEMLFSEFLEMIEKVEKERDELLDVLIHLEISKLILRKKSLLLEG